ncbi:MAG: zf-HC2 domain-containing protein [Acidimicrobiales bacterium]
MRCESCREVISARLDGEARPAEVATADAHLAGCLACQAWAAAVTELQRAVRVRRADAVPDLTASILDGAPELAPEPKVHHRRQPVTWPRYALFAIALTRLVLAVPALVLGLGADASVHVARELGVWDAALAVGLLVAAYQPERSRGLLPMALALGGFMAVAALVDVFAGQAPAGSEAVHVLELAGVVVLWRLARTVPGVPTGVRWRPA